jgi:hypothetical protein
MKVLALLLLLLSSPVLAGNVTKVPPVNVAGSYYQSFAYFFRGGIQNELADWNCMPKADGSVPTTGGSILTTAYNGTAVSNHDCSTGTAVKDWDADTTGGVGFFDYMKPTGVKWTATSMACMHAGVIPTNADVAGENVDIRLVYRTKTVDVEDSTVLELSSTHAANTPVTVTPDLVIGSTSDLTGMAVQVKADPDSAGGVNYTALSVLCTVTVKVEA